VAEGQVNIASCSFSQVLQVTNSAGCTHCRPPSN